MSSVRASLFLSFGERYIALIVNIIALIVVAHLLTPEETGLYSVAAGFINIAQTLREFGVANYIQQEKDLTEARLATALGLSVGLGLIVAGLFAGASAPLADFFGDARLRAIVLVLSLNFLSVAVNSVGFAQLRRHMNFNATARINITQNIAHALVSMSLAALGFGALGLAWASVLGNFASLAMTAHYLGGAGYPRPGFGEWRRILGFGVFASGGYLIQEVGQRLPDILIGRLLGFQAAGNYSRGNGLITLLEQALLGAVMPVAMSAMAVLHREDSDMRAPFLKMLDYTTAAAFPFLCMMSALALPIIDVAFGPQWLSAVPTARILCLAGGPLVVIRATMTLCAATGAMREMFRLQLIALPIQLLALLAGALFSIEGAASGTLIGGALVMGLCLHSVNGLIGTEWRQITAILAGSTVISLASLAVPLAVLFLHGITPDDLWGPGLVAGFGGVLSWFACIFGMRHPLHAEILTLARHLGTRFGQHRSPGGGRPE